MPKIQGHASGTFCWVELATTDQSSAKSFYASLFGWDPVDSPIGPGEFYTSFKLDGCDAAAGYTMRAEEKASAPPHWNLYVAVANADETTRLVAGLGGKVLMGPFEVMNHGRMSVIQDPTGAVMCIWQAKDNAGTTITGESGTLCWADLSTPDSAAAKAFYEGLFGWSIGPQPNYPPDYLVIMNGHAPIAGIQSSAQRNPNLPPHWMVFFETNDADGVAAKAKQIGGKEHLAPMSMGRIRMAVLADPQGATFSVIQPYA